MTSFVLRLIALIAMLIDHTAYVFVPSGSRYFEVMRAVGRLAMPIFAFLVAEGYVHTSSRLKYALRLAAFAVISEVPFDYAFHHRWLEFQRGQNVYFTLLLGLLALISMGGARILLGKVPQLEKYAEEPFAQMLVASPAIVFCCWLAKYIKCDYGWTGVAIICAFYLFRDQRGYALLAFAGLNVLGLCTGSRPAANVLGDKMFYFKKSLQWYALAAMIPLALYNDEPGNKKYRYLFYSFYPAHLLVLGILRTVLRG